MKALVIAGILVAAHGPQLAVKSQQAVQLVSREVFKDDPEIGLSLFSDPNDPAFYFVEAAWDNPHGSMIAGHFAVNSRTATLWNVQGSVCFVLTSTNLAKFQQTLRRGLAINPATFGKLASQRPIVCSEVERPRDASAY